LIRRPALAAARCAVALAVGWGLPIPAAAQSYDPADEWHGLPEGEGREEVFYTCVACHSMATVMQQRLSRRWWELTIERMVDDMGMAEPDAAEREIILDYLEEHFGQDSPR
jgi:hypothetical protein